jgi:hypothetical protein
VPRAYPHCEPACADNTNLQQKKIMQLLNILIVSWLLKGIWDLALGLITLLVALLQWLWACLDLGFYFVRRAIRSLWRCAFPTKSRRPTPSGKKIVALNAPAMKNRTISEFLQTAGASATGQKATRSSPNLPLEVHGHTTSTQTKAMNISEEESYREACQEWLHHLPASELPLLINLVVSQFRNGLIPQEEAQKILDRFRIMIIRWKKNNTLIQQMLSTIPDED